MSAAVRSAVEDEILTAATTLALSFDADPLYRFLLPVAKERRRWLEVIMALSIHEVFRDETVYVAGDPGGGAVILVGPGNYPPPLGRRFGFLIRRLPRPDIPAPPWRLLRYGLRAWRAIQEVHPSCPHYYLPVIGVHPQRTGAGLGRLLLDHAIHLAERDRVPLYLETSNPANLGFYRRFAFEVASELAPEGVPPIWTMIRHPTG